MYGEAVASAAIRSAFLFFFLFFFFSALLPWGELSGLEPLEGCFLKAVTWAGAA
jgi:hypothetical protein